MVRVAVDVAAVDAVVAAVGEWVCVSLLLLVAGVGVVVVFVVVDEEPTARWPKICFLSHWSMNQHPWKRAESRRQRQRR